MHTLGQTRTAMTAALTRLGTDVRQVQVRESHSLDGDLTLDAYLTAVS